MMSREKREAIAKRLEQIAALNSGSLTPKAVVDDARSQASPLHDSFEWDDAKAAERYRLDQARDIIRSVRVEVKTAEATVSTVRYVHDPRKGHEQGYVDVVRLRSQKDIARDAVRSELQYAKSAFDRAHDIAVVLELDSEIESLQQHVDEVKGRLDAA